MLAKSPKASALQKRVDAQIAANQKLSDRIKSEGGAAVATLMKLLHDVAAAAVIDEELNEKLGRDAPIVGADYLARARSAKPREIISEQEIALWVFAENGNLIGDQDLVNDHGNGHGTIQGAQHSIRAVLRAYKQIEYAPAVSGDLGEPLWNALRLPSMDGPDIAWGDRKYSAPFQVLEALELKSGGESSRIMTELVPLAPHTTPAYRR